MGYKTCSNMRAYRGTTSTANQEILDLSVFGSGKFVVNKLIFIPDVDCNVNINNRGYNDKIESGLEINPEDGLSITSFKIVEANTAYYIQIWIA